MWHEDTVVATIEVPVANNADGADITLIHESTLPARLYRTWSVAGASTDPQETSMDQALRCRCAIEV